MTIVKRRGLLIFASLYVVFMGGLIYGLFQLRSQSTSIQNQSDWDDWREAPIHGEAFDGPVKRKQPRSTRPPIERLLGEYFVTCLAATIIFGTALFVTFAFITRGLLTSQPVIHDDPPTPANSDVDEPD